METLPHLLTKVVPLALGAAMSPVVLTVQVLTLAKNRFPLRRTWAVAAGCLAVTVAWTAVALLATNKTPSAHSGTPSPSSGVFALAFAVVLVGLGVHSLLRGDTSDDPQTGGDDERPRTLAFFAIGLGVMVTNITSFVLFFPAAHAVGISDADRDDTDRCRRRAGGDHAAPRLRTTAGRDAPRRRAQPSLDRLGAFVTDHRASINAMICFVFAVYLAVRGIDILR